MVLNIRSLSSLIFLSIVYNVISPSEAIVKGEKAQPGDFPSIVSLRNETGGHNCAGTLVTRKHIVTTASCLYDDMTLFYNNGTGMRNPDDVKVLVGTLSSNQGVDIYEVEKFIQHPEYVVDHPDTWLNDVAVVVLKEEVDAKLLTTPIPAVPPKNGATGIAAGWGTVSYDDDLEPMKQHDFPTDLQKLAVRIQDRATCDKKYRENEDYSSALPLINSNYGLCGLPVVDGAGMCVRDGGDPLIVDGEFVGISSSGIPCGKGFADLYISIAAHHDFIINAINA